MTLYENNITVINIYWFFESEKSTTQLKSAIIISESSFMFTKTAKYNKLKIEIFPVILLTGIN
jgi:hypothetical protein